MMSQALYYDRPYNISVIDSISSPRPRRYNPLCVTMRQSHLDINSNNKRKEHLQRPFHSTPGRNSLQEDRSWQNGFN